MAKGKSRKLKSDLKLTRDRNGRLRIGGKFASKAQVGAWKAARSRRGLSTRPVRSTPRRQRTTEPRLQRIQAAGGRFIGESVSAQTERSRRCYTFPGRFDPELLAEIMSLEMEHDPTGNPALFVYMEGENDAGGFVKTGTPQVPFWLLQEEPSLLDSDIEKALNMPSAQLKTVNSSMVCVIRF